MNISGFLITFIGGLYLAVFSIESKRQLNSGWKETPALFTLYSRLIAAGFLLIIAACTGGMELSEGWWLPLLVTSFLNIGIQFAHVRAQALEDVSLVTPIAATTPAIVILTSMWWGEFASPLGWLGVWVLSLGTYILNMGEYVEKRRSSGDTRLRTWLMPFLLLWRSKGMRYAFLCALLATFSLNFDAQAYRKANVAFASAIMYTIAALPNAAMASTEWKRRAELTRPRVSSLVLVGLFLCISACFSHLAFRYSITPYVAALKRLAIPCTIVLAYLILHERVNFRGRLLGGTVMAVGAMLIGIS